MALIFPLVHALFALTLTASTAAEDIANEESQRLSDCLTLIEDDAEAAYEDSLAWLYEGNRPGARFCNASALIALDHPEDAALKLEALANAPDGGSLEDRAVYLSKAGNAWLLAGFPDEAIVALNNALLLSDEDPSIYLDRARAYLLLEDWAKGETDLDEVLKRQPGEFDAWFLRAQARYRQDRYEEALADIDQARTLNSENIDVLVLRGQIRETRRLEEATAN